MLWADSLSSAAELSTESITYDVLGRRLFCAVETVGWKRMCAAGEFVNRNCRLRASSTMSWVDSLFAAGELWTESITYDVLGRQFLERG